MDHFKFEYEVCMDPVTTNQKFETDETKFFLDVHGTCTPPYGFVLLTQNEKVPLKELNLAQHASAKALTFKVKRKS
jgi:hypothetical protein